MTDNRVYYVMQIEYAPGVWSPEFGDFDRAVVTQEISDRVDGYDEDDNGNELKRKNYRIQIDTFSGN
mgnify:FL=1|jgi:hypothetical protein|tara:strand:+ start:484 stop:684 length:201 start_codon:yes stop_codon:yes gene_type:complete